MRVLLAMSILHLAHLLEKVIPGLHDGVETAP
jgi:hypothetical protein